MFLFLFLLFYLYYHCYCYFYSYFCSFHCYCFAFSARFATLCKNGVWSVSQHCPFEGASPSTRKGHIWELQTLWRHPEVLRLVPAGIFLFNLGGFTTQQALPRMPAFLGPGFLSVELCPRPPAFLSCAWPTRAVGIHFLLSRVSTVMGWTSIGCRRPLPPPRCLNCIRCRQGLPSVILHLDLPLLFWTPLSICTLSIDHLGLGSTWTTPRAFATHEAGPTSGQP